jgi:hypothetical protein
MREDALQHIIGRANCDGNAAKTGYDLAGLT